MTRDLALILAARLLRAFGFGMAAVLVGLHQQIPGVCDHRPRGWSAKDQCIRSPGDPAEAFDRQLQVPGGIGRPHRGRRIPELSRNPGSKGQRFQLARSCWDASNRASLLTALVAGFGRRLLALVFRADLGNIIKLRADAPDNQIEVEWIRQLVRNLELLIAWLLVWVILHFGAIVIAGLVLGPGHGAPAAVLIPVEVVPGFFVAVSVARLGMTAWQLPRIIKAVGEARGASQPPPAWTQRRGLLLPLVTATDLDFVAALALLVFLEALART